MVRYHQPPWAVIIIIIIILPIQSLSHFMFDCPATSAQRDSMFAEIRSLPGCAEKLRSVLSMADSSIKVLRFVHDDIRCSSGRCRMVSPCIAAFLVKP
ncbi:hypothetical protein COO60DRAFT_436959 [Scenedesmus sp. NREL 46B-D3]|nr:hypothetical protein COO60DRAFT_436959 [Scenedesmus sp. NREL 46B-D3]